MTIAAEAATIREMTPNELVGLQSGINAILKIATDARAESAARFDAIDREILEQRGEIFGLRREVGKHAKEIDALERGRPPSPPSQRPPAPSWSDLESTHNGTRRAITQEEWQAATERAAGRLSLSVGQKVLTLTIGAIVLSALTIVAVASLKSAYGRPAELPRVEPTSATR